MIRGRQIVSKYVFVTSFVDVPEFAKELQGWVFKVENFKAKFFWTLRPKLLDRGQ